MCNHYAKGPVLIFICSAVIFQVEEATAAVTVGPLGPDITMSETDPERDDTLVSWFVCIITFTLCTGTWTILLIY